MSSKRKREEVEAEVDVEELKTKLFDLEEGLDRLEEQKQKELLSLEVELFKKKMPFYEKRDETIAKIPGFWSQTVRHHPILFSIFSDQDKQLIKSLKNVKIERKNQYSMSVELEFEENPYIENLILKKEIFSKSEDDGVPPKVTCTEIQWKKPDEESCFPALFSDDEERGNLDLVYEMWEEPLPYFTGKHNIALTEE